MGKNLARIFAQAAVLVLGMGMALAQTTITFPGNTLSDNFGAWGGKGHFYTPTFNVNAAGGIDITYYDIDVSQFTEANDWTPKGVAMPGVSATNSMTSIDPNNNSVWCNILNQEVPSGVDWDGHAISTVGSNGTLRDEDDTRHQGTQDWYKTSAGVKTDGPADGPYYNNESYVIPNPRHPNATPKKASELNSYDFRLRILPTGTNTYTYEMWFRMHISAATVEGAYWVYNIAMNNSADAWRKFAHGATDVFTISGLDLSSVHVFMGLGNFLTPAPQALTWGKIEVTGTLTAASEKGLAKDALASYMNSSDKRIKEAAAKAAEFIDQSLDPELWSGVDHLTAKGRKVFDKEKEAVKELMEKILKHYTGTVFDDARDAVGHLVNADRNLAQTAIDEVDCNGDPQCVHELEKANEEMAKAAADNAAGKYDNAIDDYKKAWEHALKAAKKAVLPDNEDLADVPAAGSLNQNYPNPFNPVTAISFYVPKASPVSVVVYNTLGQQVAELVNGTMEAGYHQVKFDATNLGSGIYFYRMTAGQFTEIRRMMLLK